MMLQLIADRLRKRADAYFNAARAYEVNASGPLGPWTASRVRHLHTVGVVLKEVASAIMFEDLPAPSQPSKADHTVVDASAE